MQAFGRLSSTGFDVNSIFSEAKSSKKVLRGVPAVTATALVDVFNIARLRSAFVRQ